MFDWVFERANSHREQRKTLLQVYALFLRPSVFVAAIIRFCSWPMRKRGTENVYIQYVSAAKCCCRRQQPVSALNRRKNTLLVHLSLNAIHQSVWACLWVRERHCVCGLNAWIYNECVCLCSVEIMRGQSWWNLVDRHGKHVMSVFFFSASYSLLPCNIWMLSASVWAAAYAQWIAKPSIHG